MIPAERPPFPSWAIPLLMQALLWIFALGVAWGQFSRMREDYQKLQARIDVMITEDGPMLTELKVMQREHARRIDALEEGQ